VLSTLVKKEWPLLVSYGSLVVLLLLGSTITGALDSASTVGLVFAWLFVVILLASFSVVRHAESLAVIFGEPYGTLILTLSVIGLEVLMIATVMVTGENVPTMARDTMFAVLMIVLNGLLGVAIFVGARKFRQQDYNIQSSHTYIGMLILLIGIGLVLPRFMPQLKEDAFHYFLIVGGLVMYAIFLWVQTVEHRGFFEFRRLDGKAEDHGHADTERGGVYHAVLLVLTLLPVVLLAKGLATVLNADIVQDHWPPELSGLVIALLILAPEGMAAIQAARHDNQQRAINICLGSGLATIGLTIPVVLIISLVTNDLVILGLDPESMVLLAISVLLLKSNLDSGRTNILMGAMHMVLFASYVALIFM
tara:strand:- start:162 stop:1253 length:1092 start_codon:yes stop_codon:yes gene_type:complete